MPIPQFNAARFAAGTRRMHLLITTIGLLAIGIVAYGFYSADRLSTVDAALVRAAMALRLEAVTTYLVIEGLLSDGMAMDLDPVWAPLDAAFSQLRAAFRQSWRLKALPPLRDPDADAADIEELSLKIAAFKALAGERLTGRRSPLLEGRADRAFRLAFEDLVKDLERLEGRLGQSASAGVAFFRFSQTALIILMAGLTVASALVFRRFAGQRLAAFLSLQSANQRLQSEIAERLASENALRASEVRLKQLVEEYQDFTHAVSHDLKAPLISLKGFSKEIKTALAKMGPVIDAALPALDGKSAQDAAAALHEDLPEAVGYMDASVSKMERLTQAILKLSRLGRRELVIEPLDVNGIVADVLKSLGLQIKARGIRLTVGSLPFTRADKMALEQIFSNLIGNALNYLDPARAGEIEIGGESLPDEDLFYVRDNGRGIRAGDLEKVFNLFERLDHGAAEGEGMGLAYVRTLVHRHDGRVFCRSEYGVGSEFTFTISKRIIGHGAVSSHPHSLHGRR